MTTVLRECGICLYEIEDDEPAYRCLVFRKRQRRYESSNTSVCRECVNAVREEGIWTSDDGRRNLMNLPGHDDAAPCVACSRPVVATRDGRRKIVTCSDKCRAKYYTARRSVDVSVTACEGCGSEMTGRSDRRFCSPRCRQRAYRRRLNLELVQKDAEVLERFEAIMDAQVPGWREASQT